MLEPKYKFEWHALPWWSCRVADASERDVCEVFLHNLGSSEAAEAAKRLIAVAPEYDALAREIVALNENITSVFTRSNMLKTIADRLIPLIARVGGEATE